MGVAKDMISIAFKNDVADVQGEEVPKISGKK